MTLVICDEKPSIQARQRKHVLRGPRPRNAMRVEHEYERRGALCYFAAWDVRHAKLFGHCTPKSGIARPLQTNWSVRFRADLAHLLSRLNASDTLPLSA